MVPRSIRRSLLSAFFALGLAVFRVAAEDNDYVLGPDSQVDPAVPHGSVLQQAFNAGTHSVFPGTSRDYWIYVPRQYTGDKPAALMVFQDGGGYLSPTGQWRVPVVFDNLIAKGEMPVTIGVFVNPGVVPSTLGTNALPRYNRSYEYDGLGDAYARFLVEELLPEVTSRYLITTSANGRAIAGSSSGAIAAFNAAWERPDQFRRVFSTIGTYVGLRGADVFPTLIRKTEPKPLRVFLQDGYKDQDIYGGNWWIANQAMLSALQFAGYEVTHQWGTGGHDGKQGGSIFPDAMRWLWKDYPKPVKAGSGAKHLAAGLIDGDWRLVGQGYQFPGGLAADAAGAVYFTDQPANRIYKVALDGAVAILRDAADHPQAMAVTPDGRVLASRPATRGIVELEGKAGEKIISTDAAAKAMGVRHTGTTYFTDPAAHAVKAMDAKGKVTTLDTGIEFPSGLAFSPDQSLLYVSDLVGQLIYSFQVRDDGTLAFKQRYFHLHMPDDPRGSGADGLCVDTAGRLYVASSVGVQFCDQAGRVNGILNKPEPGAWASSVCFGGKDRDELYLAAGDKVWKRKLKAKGAFSFEAPIVPPGPRL